MNISALKNVVSGGSKIFGFGKAFVMAHRPELLYGASVVSTVASVGLAAKGGYDSGVKVASHVEGHDIDTSVVPVKEKIQMTWKNYVPAVIGTASAVTSTTGLHLVHVKEKKAMAAAALMALEEIRDQANDMKEEALKILEDPELSDEEKRERLENTEWTAESGFTDDLPFHNGKYPCWDDLANRPVNSNREYIRRAGEVLLNEINRKGHANLNLFYEELNMMESQIGSQLGWTQEDIEGYGGGTGTEFVAFGATELPDGSQATAFWFKVPPTTDYVERAKSDPQNPAARIA